MSALPVKVDIEDNLEMSAEGQRTFRPCLTPRYVGRDIPIGSFGPYPPDFHDTVVNASATIKKVAQALQNAFSANDPAKAVQLFTPDAVFEDMALHTRVEGQLQIQRYLSRGLALLPYGTSATVAHVVGSDQGGGYEWRAAMNAAPLVRGITALELDDNGKITRFTTIYDSFQFSDAAYQTLVQLAAENRAKTFCPRKPQSFSPASAAAATR